MFLHMTFCCSCCYCLATKGLQQVELHAGTSSWTSPSVFTPLESATTGYNHAVGEQPLGELWLACMCGQMRFQNAAQLRRACLVTATVCGVSRHATMNILAAQHQDSNTYRPSPSLHAVSAGMVFAGAVSAAKVIHLCQSGL